MLASGSKMSKFNFHVLFILAALTIFLAFNFEFASGELYPNKIAYQEKFCNLEKYYGFDCMTIIIWFDRYVPCGELQKMFGCAHYPENLIVYAIGRDDVLWHEIQHLKCQCNFHGVAQ